MYINHTRDIVKTLIVSGLSVFFLANCSSSNDDPITPVETAAAPPIIGKVTEVDGTAVDAATVNLDDLKSAKFVNKLIGGLEAKTDVKGKFTIVPPAFADFQLVVTKDGFVTQRRDLSVTDAGVSLSPTILSRVDIVKLIDNTTGGIIDAETDTGSKVEVEIPTGAANQTIEVSLTLLTGVEIPSTLPTEAGKTLLPVGALSVGISPAGTVLTAAANASVPVPAVLQETNRTFDVYALENGLWIKHADELTSGVDNSVNFQITTAGTYMVMTAVADVTNSAESSESTEVIETVQVAPGDTIIGTSTDNIEISGTESLSAADKAEVDALIQSFLEKRFGTQFGVPNEVITTAPSVAETNAQFKLICSSTTTRTTFAFVFVFGSTRIIVIFTTINTVIFCADDGQPEPTGAVGGTS